MAQVPYYDALSTELAAYVSSQMTSVPVGSVTTNMMTNWVSAFLYSKIPVKTDLQNITPEFENVVMQLMLSLQSKQTWTDTAGTSVGQALIEWMASIYEAHQMSIETATRETFLDTAWIPDSVISIARMLGNRISRKSPASRTFSITRTGTGNSIVKAYTQFLIGDTKYFNRSDIVFYDGIFTINPITLYQGEITTVEYTSTGKGYTRYELGLPPWQTSDVDITCKVNNVEYKRVTDGLWRYDSTDKIFWENTLPNGDVEVWIGNGIYGAQPAAAANIVFTAVVTKGKDGNDLVVSTYNSAVTGHPDKTVVPLTAAIGGTNEKDKEFYSLNAPFVYASRDRMVSRSDYEAKTREYEDVIDASLSAQYELGKRDFRFGNYGQLTIVTGSTWNEEQKQTLKSWIASKGIFGMNIDVVMGVPVGVSIQAEIYCKPSALLDEVKNHLIQQVQERFKPRRGCLGASMFLSEIYQVLEGKGTYQSLITRTKILNPKADINIGGAESKTRYLSLVNIDLIMRYDNSGFVDID